MQEYACALANIVSLKLMKRSTELLIDDAPDGKTVKVVEGNIRSKDIFSAVSRARNYEKANSPSDKEKGEIFNLLTDLRSLSDVDFAAEMADFLYAEACMLGLVVSWGDTTVGQLMGHELMMYFGASGNERCLEYVTLQMKVVGVDLGEL